MVLHKMGRDPFAGKISGQFRIEGFDGYVKYIAIPLIEKFIFMDDTHTEVGMIYSKKAIDKFLQIDVITSEYTGPIEDYLFLANMQEGDDRIYDVEWDVKPKGSQTKPRKDDWKVIDQSYDQEGLEGNAIEDYLYKAYTKEELTQDKNLTWVKDKHYYTLRTKEETDVYFNHLYELPKDTLLSVDTETTGLKADRFQTDKIVGISLSHEMHFGVYIPIMQKHGKNNEYTRDELLTKLKPLLDVRLPDTQLPLIGHNLGFDWKVFKMYDIELNIVHDTYVMSALIHWAENTHRRSLKDQVSHYFGVDVLELSEMFHKLNKTQLEKLKEWAATGASMDPITRRKLELSSTYSDLIDFRYVPEWMYELYGPADGDFPLWLYDKLTSKGGDWEKYKGSLDTVYALEIEVIPAFSEQEFYGLRFEAEGVRGLEVDAIAKLEQVERDIYDIVGYEFNIGSSQQLGKVLFEDMGCPPLDKFKSKQTGAWKTDKPTMDLLYGYVNEDGTPQFPIVKLLVERSKLSHAISSFYSNIPVLSRNEYLFPSYSQLGAATGRVTCREPNVQQMYPAVRTYIVPDSDEYYFATCDFSQIERRVMGGMSGDEAIKESFITNPEADSHIQTYSNMTGVPYELVTSSQRSIGKTLNFATAYGVEDEKLAMNIYGKDDKVHQALANDMRKQYFDSVPVLRDYLEDERDKSEGTGFASTLFGRRRYIKEFNYDVIKEYSRQKGRRAAGNMIIQGTAADILKIAMVRLRESFRAHGLYEDKACMKMNVHDEVTYQIHKSVHPDLACKIMKEAMEVDLSDTGFPPIYIGMNIGYNWKAGKRDDLEAPVLLMEELIENANYHLDNDIEFEPVADPQEYWLQQIKEYSIRQIVEEGRNGYKVDGVNKPITNLTDAYKNPRISKYSDYFGSITTPVDRSVMVMECLLADDVQAILDDFDNIIQGRGKHMLEAITYLNEHRPTVVTHDNIKHISFFGGAYQTVLEALQEPRSIEGITYTGRGMIITFSDNFKIDTTKHKGDFPKVHVDGQEVEDEPLTIDELIQRDLSLTGDLFTLKCETLTPEFVELLQEICIPAGVIHNLPLPDSKRFSLVLQLRGGTQTRVHGVLIEEALPVFIEALTAFYCHEPFNHVYTQLEALMDELLGEE